MAIGIAVCIVCVTLALRSQTPPANYDIEELLKKNPQDYALSFGHILDLTPQAMGAFKIPLLVTGIAFAAGSIATWLLRRKNRAFTANLALTGMAVALLLAAHRGLEIFSPVLSSKVLAEEIEAKWTPGAVIEENGDYESFSSVQFYTDHQTRILNGRRNNIWYGSTFPDAPKIFDNDESFQKLWQGGTTVFLLTAEESTPGEVSSVPYCRIGKWGGKLLLTNALRLCPAPGPGR
jgi:hypothetical protein